MLMRADDAEEDPQATTNNTSISLKNGERLLHTARQEIPDKRFPGTLWLWRNPGTGWTSTTWILKTHLRKPCQDTQQIPSLPWGYMEERWMLKINFAGLWWGGSMEEKLPKALGIARGGMKDRLTAALPLWTCSEKAPKRFSHQTSRFGVVYLPGSSCWCVYSGPWVLQDGTRELSHKTLLPSLPPTAAPRNPHRNTPGAHQGQDMFADRRICHW